MIAMTPKPEYFQDFKGPDCDATAGRDYIKRQFIQVARTANRSKDKGVYVQ
jgi:hypothetical protein